jgi:hypothetical protein
MKVEVRPAHPRANAHTGVGVCAHTGPHAHAGARQTRLALAVTALVAACACAYITLLVGAPTVLAAANCPNEAFRTGPSAALPDCRAYELVSPPDKNGGSVDGGSILETLNAPTAAAANGEAVTYTSGTAFTEADPQSGMTNTQYYSTRGPHGWSTRAITPTQVYPIGRLDTTTGAIEQSLYQGFSEDLTRGFLVANNPAPVAGAPAGYYNPYAFNADDFGFELLSNTTPPVQPPGPGNLNSEIAQEDGLVSIFAGFSGDDKHVIFQANDALTPNAIPGEWNLYESSEGHLELVSILPDGETAHGKSSPFWGKEPSFGSAFREDDQGQYYNFNHAISADGERIFWSDGGQVYMHEDGRHTVDISASQRTEPDSEGPEPATYQTASADGSLVYFTSCAKLTNGSTAHAPSGASCYTGGVDRTFGEELYQYNANTGALTDLTVTTRKLKHNSEELEGASVVGVFGASEDGSYVYFAAYGVLAPGASEGPGDFNIYLWHDGEISFVTQIGSATVETLDLVEGRSERTSRVSPGGLLAFVSTLNLTGYETEPLQSGVCNEYPNTTGLCSEVYEYTPSSKRLECASCNPSGAPPTANAITPTATHVLEVNHGWQDSVTQQRYLLDDGRVFFQSGDALLPQASNGKQNIYEHEPDGVGSCRTAGGCLYLISTGTSSSDSYFIDASASGSDVFIETNDQLTPADGDEQRDVYDARIDGGFAYPSQLTCSGEACRPPVTPAPAIYQAPPSATFFGAGNLVPQPEQTNVTKVKRSAVKKKAKGRTHKQKSKKRKGRSGKTAGHARKGRK